MPSSATRQVSEAERALLARFVSNPDGRVYAIFNLPEEVIAVIFAYVSRSPASFRENLLKLLGDEALGLQAMAAMPASPGSPGSPGPGVSGAGGSGGAAGGPAPLAATEKARAFHEKWVVGYGHSSVAEHATVHIGIERVSRLASARLELANPFLSFTEYSQRYQQPQRGDYVLPPELEQPGRERWRDAFHAQMDICYTAYEQLLRGLCTHLAEREPRQDGESEAAFERRVARLAFEDARYALPLATYTHLGLTGNGRAIRDSLVDLYSDPYQETTQLAREIHREVSKLLPTLLKYAEASPYRRRTRAALEHWSNCAGLECAGPGESGLTGGMGTGGAVRLLDATGAAGGPAPLDHLLQALCLELGARAPAGDRATEDEKIALFREITASLGPFDQPHPAFHFLRYQVELTISEASWHQLLRHSRRIDFAEEPPSPDRGLTIPPRIEEAGLAPVLEDACRQAGKLFWRLRDEAGLPCAAHYAVCNAHRRRVRASLDLAEVIHLVRLRETSQAQWDIRQTVRELRQAVQRVHPFTRHLPPFAERGGLSSQSG